MKSKITKVLNSEENSKRKVPNQITKSNHKTHQRINNNCHIPDFVQSFSNVENRGLNLCFSAETLTCITVASHFIILTTMREQNRHNIKEKIAEIWVQ